MSRTRALMVSLIFSLVICRLSGLMAQAPDISYQTPQTYKINAPIINLSPTNTGGAVPANSYAQVATFAGSGITGSLDGTGTAASFSAPISMAIDANGDIYVADFNNNTIRKITPAGLVTTLAGNPGVHGSANGIGAGATFAEPAGVAVDKNGNVYVADSYNNLIRKITPAGAVSTFAGVNGASGAINGPGLNATFNSPTGIAVDNAGNVYVADYNNNLIREITPMGVVSTLAGSGAPGAADGTGMSASFNKPQSLAVDAAGNVYVADLGNENIRKITPLGVVTTLAGSGAVGSSDGLGAAASFNQPYGITVDKDGFVYVADEKNNLIRKITPGGLVSTIAGNGTGGSVDGVGKSAGFSYPGSVVADDMGNLYVGDLSAFLIRKVGLTGYTIDKPLPPGLTFDTKTGTISGTPTAVSPSTNYTITAYNADGSSSTTLNIAVVDISLIFQPLPAKTVCDVDFDSGATGIGTITYTSSNTSVATIIAGLVHITGPGISVITASNGTEQTVETLTVSAALVPSITISPVAIDTCQGNAVVYTATAVNGGANPVYQWQVNGQNSGANSAVFTSSNLSNNDKIICILTSNAVCLTTPTATSNVSVFNIYPSLTATLTITSSATGPFCAGTSVTFTAAASIINNNSVYQWQVNGKDEGTNGPVFTTNNLADGDVVMCILNTAAKCLLNPDVTSNAIKIALNPADVCAIIIPNAITPNGDGINDIWNISSLRYYPSCTVNIYNRYGSLIYNSVGYPKSWDGTYNGSPLPVGTYYYIIDLKNGKKPLAGYVTILR